jgi:hypothetical protein
MPVDPQPQLASTVVIAGEPGLEGLHGAEAARLLGIGDER